ncbi:MAG TPA: MarR family winged helix-turn-helix transcriptional regulator [Thermoanaerobaculia bacterium]|jgi:DNA-binding MarR family transcriptional regulator|nr:MarR family winged helix-turn-helix transcriptional regulator [Thermoanaerobaculia bacterium]
MSVLDDIKQRKPFASKGEEALVTMLRTTDVFRRRMGGVVERHGITMQQYNVLRILRGAGADGLPTLEIAARMLEQTPGITRLVDRLEVKKLVSRRRSADDRRCVYCRITAAGLALLAALDAPMRAAADRAFGSVNKKELAHLVELLDRLRNALQEK